MKFTIAEKQNMTQFFDTEGNVHPATILKVETLTVTQVKTNERDGYEAVQIATQKQKKERVSKSVLGHTKEPFKVLREFRVTATELKQGDKLNPAEIFQAGDEVTISGVSKGKGFQGVVKRHGFKGGWNQHGQKHSHREPGSIGVGGVGRVIKGMRMAGRMGNNRITQKNVKVLAVDPENGFILVKGAVPGKRGTLIEVVQK